MVNKIYLRTIDNTFGFVTEGVNEVINTDREISEEVYNKFFELQSQGKQFKIKNTDGITFEEIFEEIIPEPTKTLPQPTVQDLQKQIYGLATQLVIGGVL